MKSGKERGMAKGRDIILSLLYRQDLSGYDINEILTKRFSHFMPGTSGTVYPVLRNLEKEGLATSRTVIQTDKPNKKVYSITPAGRAKAEKFLASPIAPDEFRSDFLFRTYLGINMGREDYASLIESEKRSIQGRLDQLMQDYDSVKDEFMSAGMRYAYDFGIRFYQDRLDFLQQHPVPQPE
ncbi:MAG: PadR family transcriptional regulator [Bifidobacterium subtile]|jgi:DNA-binding PadR family transcriptional regulator|nr:PadR family transcriptional regulator [Bifidobacterium subtile]